ncbi:hypothetical protein GCM10009736_41170 [Actinomadura bangladeshensis]
MLVMAGGAVVPIALISILLGNQWVIDAINDTGLHWDEGIAPPLYWLFFPAWRLTAGDYAWKYVAVLDLGVLLFFVLLILLAVAGARAVDAQRGAIGAVVAGWWATVVAGGIAGFMTGIMLRWALDITSDSGPFIFGAVTRGASFGFAYGWLAGLGMLLGFLMTRGRGAAVQQPGQPGQPGQYAPQQPAMPAQQPYGQPAPQQAVPYVPQQAQPQQPWGGMPQQPVPQQYQQQPYQQPQYPQQAQPQPAPPQQAQPQQQYGAPPVPPQPSAPAPEQAPPAAPGAPDEPKPDAPENAADDAAKDDDLGLADRTIIDRKRDGGDA